MLLYYPLMFLSTIWFQELLLSLLLIFTMRAPEHKEKKTLIGTFFINIECDKALERSDFLDSVDQDCIKDSWSLQADESKTEVTVRSMVWPGYIGYHRANSHVFGGVYMGTGVRCEDFPFLLWFDRLSWNV